MDMVTPNHSIPEYLRQPPVGTALPPVQTRLQELPFDGLTWEDFERLCFRLASNEANVEHCQPFGVKGQAQHGIDIYAKFSGANKYTVYQCKRESKFGPNKIQKAVQRFIDGDWCSRSERFVLCTKESLTETTRAESVEKQRVLLEQLTVKLVVWDSVQIARLLKAHRDLVADFFGPTWAEAFCGSDPHNVDLSGGSYLENLNGKLSQLLRELRWRDASKVARDLERAARQSRCPSNELCEAWLLLAEIEFHELAQQKSDSESIDVNRFRELLSQAVNAMNRGSMADHEARMASLSALLTELTQGPDEALRSLGAPTDVRRVRAVLGICLRANRDREAVDLIRNRVPEEKWLDMATLLFARLGEIERASDLVARADESTDVSVTWRTRLAFANGAFDRWHKINGKRTPFCTDEWSEEDRRLALTILEVLEPLRALVRANRRVQGELEEQALCFSVQCAAIRGDVDSANVDIAWLCKCRPLPLIVVELALRRLIERPDDIVGRLRLEHPGEFRANYLAAVVERELFGRPEEAFEEFVKLAESAKTEIEKEAVCVDLFMTCGLCSSEASERAIQIVKRLRPTDVRLLTFLRTGVRLGSMALDSARNELETIRDETDGVWWQLWAQLCDRSGDADSAQVAWENASRLLPHPEVIRHSVQVALDRRRYHSAATGLKKLLAQKPNDARLLENLSWTLVRLGDFAQATETLKRLVELLPNHVEHQIGLAQCLMRSNRLRDAIEVLRPVCEIDNPPPLAVMVQSELLAATGEHGTALELLERIAAEHWNDPSFLLTYMNRAYAAGDDRQGHDLFVQLCELRQAGRVPPEMMQETNLEQLIEHFRESQSRREALHAELVKGRLPWLWVEEMLRNTPVWAWTLRTQELTWLSEERLSRAACSVYSTNCFLVRDTANGNQIEVILPPRGSTEVVLDLSALLTLHRLKRLEDVATYFGKLILPASYGELRVVGINRFGLHQVSQEQHLDRIRKEIDRHRIHIVETADPSHQLVDEHLDAIDGHAYRLRDMIEPLRQAQRVDTPAFEEFLGVAHEASAVDDGHPALLLGAKVLVDLTTLRTLAGQAVFNATIENLSVHILAEQERELTAELNAFATARSARAAHDEMWELVERLCKQKKLEWMSISSGTDAAEETDDFPEHLLDLDAFKLARATGKPLLADDRVLQVLAVQKDSKTEAVGVEAFGSDMVLEALLESGNLNDVTVANDVLSLMSWRYRFLLPSVKLLKQWANQSKDNLPGNCLLTAANYLHDCLRDPGLHCGFESTNPPGPIAVRFVTRWINHIVEMLADVWADAEFTELQATRLSRWIGEEFIPSCPRGLWFQPAGANIEKMTPKVALMIAMTTFARVKDVRRANSGLRTLATALGVSDDEFLSITAEAIEKSDDLPLDESRIAKAMRQWMLQNSVYHVADALDPVHAIRFIELGMLKGAKPSALPEQIIDILRSPNHSVRMPTLSGPLLFLQNGEMSRTVTEVAELLLYPEHSTREAAWHYFEHDAGDSSSWLTQQTRELLTQRKHDLLSSQETCWHGAGIELVTAIRNDIFGDFAGLGQCIAAGYEPGINTYLRKVLFPTFEALAHFRPPLWSVNEQRQELVQRIQKLAQLPTLAAALTTYVEHCGYVPLCRELSASELARQWASLHPQAGLSWSDIWNWAADHGSPLARFHACEIAISNWPQFSNSNKELIRESVSLFATELMAADKESGGSKVWQLRNALAAQCLRHIETLHPCQGGERVTCFAFWLADKAACILGQNESQAAYWFDNLIRKTQFENLVAWGTARTPVQPSPLRYATLYLHSVWVPSLLGRMIQCWRDSPDFVLSDEARKLVEQVLRSERVAGLIGIQDSQPPAYAISENGHLLDLSIEDELATAEDNANLSPVVEFRRELVTPNRLLLRLRQILEMSVQEQYFLAFGFREISTVTSSCDDAVADWLSDAKHIVDVLHQLPSEPLSAMLDGLEEFQLRRLDNWGVRLPHLLAYAIERCDQAERVNELAFVLCRLSLNCGIASPIQRIMATRWRRELIELLQIWRTNMQHIAKVSEPWVASRIRATSSALSPFIGPPQHETPTPESVHPEDDSATPTV